MMCLIYGYHAQVGFLLQGTLSSASLSLSHAPLFVPTNNPCPRIPLLQQTLTLEFVRKSLRVCTTTDCITCIAHGLCIGPSSNGKANETITSHHQASNQDAPPHSNRLRSGRRNLTTTWLGGTAACLRLDFFRYRS